MNTWASAMRLTEVMCLTLVYMGKTTETKYLTVLAEPIDHSTDEISNYILDTWKSSMRCGRFLSLNNADKIVQVIVNRYK